MEIKRNLSQCPPGKEEGNWEEEMSCDEPLWRSRPTPWGLCSWIGAFIFLSWQFIACGLPGKELSPWKWKLLSCVRLFATPRTVESMGFSRPEHWSGWPFPSPGDLPNPGIKPRSPTLQSGSLPAEPQGKPKNTVLDSLSLLQRNFPTQELNGSLLHCRWILYQLELSGCYLLIN